MTARDVIASSIFCGMPDGLSLKIAADEADVIVSKLSAAGFSIVHESEIHGATVDHFRREIARLLPHYQSMTATDAGRRQLLEHFNQFALRALPDGGVAVDIGHD